MRGFFLGLVAARSVLYAYRHQLDRPVWRHNDRGWGTADPPYPAGKIELHRHIEGVTLASILAL